jgi:carbon monoxide dehydrogenase subunit G
VKISNEFEVPQGIDAVWEFFGDIPLVAACLPGADLTDEIGDDHYEGVVTISAGPVKLEFDGNAKIIDRDEATRTITVDAHGADRKGRGQAALGLDAGLNAVPGGTRVDVSMDLQLSGAAAQYGRGMVNDVTSVLLDDFATNLQNRLAAIEAGLDPHHVEAVAPASGFVIVLRATRMALVRVFRRFFLPYDPETV